VNLAATSRSWSIVPLGFGGDCGGTNPCSQPMLLLAIASLSPVAVFVTVFVTCSAVQPTIMGASIRPSCQDP
jgi:hypothetical protein